MSQSTTDVRDIGSRRELFIDRYLIDSLAGTARLEMHRPVPANVAIKHDAPWEGRYSIYGTMIYDGRKYRYYYRGWPEANAKAVTCCAESPDGVRFTKPTLGLCEFEGSKENNIILTDTGDGENSVVHNFCPFLDTKPGVEPARRFKAMGGGHKVGMFALASADGIRWSRMSDQPVVNHPTFSFDSQNVPFWSEAEGCYVFYYRTWRKRATTKPGSHGVRWISRRTSEDFLHWSDPVEMETPGAELEEFYVNQTHPYFRAPHLYIALAARFWPGRRVLSEAEAQAMDVPVKYFNDISDAVLMSTRGGNVYHRTFLESFIRPGLGGSNWVSRANYPVLGVVPTKPYEMSIYVDRDYTQLTNYTQRCTLRTDGFASVSAGYAGGELLTPPLRFSGSKLSINYATSAAGSVRVEIQDAQGKAIPGFALADGQEIIGDHIERTVGWSGGDHVGTLAGQTVRLRFVLKDADLYSLQFCQG